MGAVHVCYSSCNDSGIMALVRSLPSSLEEFPLLHYVPGWHSWDSCANDEAIAQCQDLSSVRAYSWPTGVEPAVPAGPSPMMTKAEQGSLPPPLGTGEPLLVPVPSEPTQDALAAELQRDDVINHVRSVTKQEALIDVPSPCYSQEADTEDDAFIKFNVTGLAPMQRVLLHFSGIHSSHYIGINKIRIFSATQELYYNVLTPGAEAVRQSLNDWWAVVGEEHELKFEFEGEHEITSIWLNCANGPATPKQLRVTCF